LGGRYLMWMLPWNMMVLISLVTGLAIKRFFVFFYSTALCVVFFRK